EHLYVTGPAAAHADKRDTEIVPRPAAVIVGQALCGQHERAGRQGGLSDKGSPRDNGFHADAVWGQFTKRVRRGKGQGGPSWAPDGLASDTYLRPGSGLLRASTSSSTPAN